MPEEQEQQRLVRDHFEKLSATWSDLYNEAVSFQNYNFIIRRQRVFELFDKRDGRYLDAGCGTGDLIPGLWERGREVFAIDVSAEMVEHAKARVALPRGQQRAEFSVGDVYNLSFPDNYFDAIIGVGLIEYLNDVDAALKQMYRVLKPGGILILTVPSLASPFKAFEVLVPTAKQLVKRALAMLGRKQPAREFYHRLFFPWQLDRQLRRLGFRKRGFAFCTYGFFGSRSRRMQAFSLSLSRKLDRFSRSPLGILATNYIVKVEKPQGVGPGER